MRHVLLALAMVSLCALDVQAQNAITQQGPVVKDSPMMFKGDRQARQGATAAGAPTGQIVTTGDAVIGGRCDYSAPTDDPDGYYRLCLDGKEGAIRLDGTKGPAKNTLKLDIDGQVYDVPGTGVSIAGTDTAVANNTVLKTVVGTLNKRAVRLGYTKPGDGGFASYNWSATNCVTPDDGAQVQPTGATGCWVADFALADPNPLQFGADPKGVVDATAAINKAAKAAAALNLNVYIPAGTYKVTDEITIATGQVLYGAGRTRSILRASSDFRMSALGVVRLNVSSGLISIGITLVQPDSAVRASYTPYPPAVYMVAAAGAIVDRIRISGARVGIDATGNTGQAFFGHMEIGAMDWGIKLQGAKDFVHGTTWHFWVWGFATTNQMAVYKDGNSGCASLGDTDVLEVNAITAYYCNINVTAADTIAPTTIGRLIMDGTNQNLTVTGQRVAISTMHIKALSTKTAVNVGAAGVLSINYFDLTANSTGPSTADAIVVDGAGARLAVNGGRVLQSSPAHSTFRLLSGGTFLHNIEFREPAGIDRTVPDVHMTGGFVVMTGCSFTSAGATASGLALSVGADSADNNIAANSFSTWDVAFPSSITLGEYGPNNSKRFTATPTMGFSTNGDFAMVNPGTNVTSYQFLGGGIISYYTLVQFDANNYTTASGSLQLDLGITNALPIQTSPAIIGHMNNVTFDSTRLIFPEITAVPSASAGKIGFTTAISNGATSALSTTAIPPGKAGILFRVSGTYRYR